MEERRKWQRHIFGAARAAGLTDRDDLHALISSVCGKESLTEIDRQDYSLIIRELAKRSGGTASVKKQPPAKTRSVEGMSEGQVKKVWRLMYELKQYDREPVTATIGERLCGIIHRELKVDVQPQEPFIWLTHQNGSTLIERLKWYVINAQKRYERGVSDGDIHG